MSDPIESGNSRTERMAYVNTRAHQIASRYSFMGTEKADVVQEGIAAFLAEYPAVESGAEAWAEVLASIERQMTKAARNGLFHSGRIVSLDAINDNLNESADSASSLLDFLPVAVRVNEFSSIIPDSPAERLALIDECNDRIAKSGGKSTLALRKKRGGRIEGRIFLKGAGTQFVLGTFESESEARSAQKLAYRMIRDRCFPVYPNDSKQSLREKPHTLTFWRAMAHECSQEGALPEFMYLNPEDALIFIEEISEQQNKRANDSAYAIESRSIEFYTRRDRMKGRSGSAAQAHATARMDEGSGEST